MATISEINVQPYIYENITDPKGPGRYVCLSTGLISPRVEKLGDVPLHWSTFNHFKFSPEAKDPMQEFKYPIGYALYSGLRSRPWSFKIYEDCTLDDIRTPEDLKEYIKNIQGDDNVTTE